MHAAIVVDYRHVANLRCDSDIDTAVTAVDYRSLFLCVVRRATLPTLRTTSTHEAPVRVFACFLKTLLVAVSTLLT